MAATVDVYGKRGMSDDYAEQLVVVTYLLYDADCGPCTKFKNLVIWLDISHRLVPVPMKSEFAYDLVRGRATRRELMSAFHIVSTYPSAAGAAKGNDIFGAGDALIQLIRLLPFGSVTYWLIAHFRPLAGFIRWVYARISGLRSVSVSCTAPYRAPRNPEAIFRGSTVRPGGRKEP